MANELIEYLTYKKPSKIGTKEIKNIRSIESAFLTFCKVVLVKSHSTNKENSTERKRLQNARKDTQAQNLLINDGYWDYNSIKDSFYTITSKLTQIKDKNFNEQEFKKLLDNYRKKHPNFPDIINHINLEASKQKALKGIEFKKTKPNKKAPVPQSKEKKSNKSTPPKPSSKPPEPPHKSKAFTTPQKSSKSEVTEKKVDKNKKEEKKKNRKREKGKTKTAKRRRKSAEEKAKRRRKKAEETAKRRKKKSERNPKKGKRKN